MCYKSYFTFSPLKSRKFLVIVDWWLHFHKAFYTIYYKHMYLCLFLLDQEYRISSLTVLALSTQGQAGERFEQDWQQLGICLSTRGPEAEYFNHSDISSRDGSVRTPVFCAISNCICKQWLLGHRATDNINHTILVDIIERYNIKICDNKYSHIDIVWIDLVMIIALMITIIWLIICYFPCYL